MEKFFSKKSRLIDLQSVAQNPIYSIKRTYMRIKRCSFEKQGYFDGTNATRSKELQMDI